MATYTVNRIGSTIINGVLSTDHVHMFVSIPPHHAVSNVMRKVKGRSSRKIQMEFPERYWGRHFWARAKHNDVRRTYLCAMFGKMDGDARIVRADGSRSRSQFGGYSILHTRREYFRSK